MNLDRPFTKRVAQIEEIRKIQALHTTRFTTLEAKIGEMKAELLQAIREAK